MSVDSSFMFPVDSTKACKVLELEEGENTSLYIPVFPPQMQLASSTLDEDVKFEPKHLKYMIENCMRIGKVRRIDFATREVPNFPTPQTCAFIHFDCLYDNENTKNMRDSLKTNGRYEYHGFNNPGAEHCVFKFKMGNNRAPLRNRPHLLFKINHKPIDSAEKDTRNLQQVIAENKLLIAKLQEKEDEIRLLRNELQEAKMDKKMTIDELNC